MGEVVETRAGRVRGGREGRIHAFRNIPFGASTAGVRRFTAPEPAPAWAGTRDVAAPGPIPPQRPSRLSRVLGEYALPHDEDCLSLSVLSPGLDRQARPVMVWLYGGAFLTGGNALDWYDGIRFAEAHDCVFVGVNYRLGALGYLSADGVSPGNLGLRDQCLALRWVRDNIERFGGDPERVTLAGQSAGAISTLALLASPHSDGLFHQAILQSGRFASLSTMSEVRTSGDAFVERAGGTAQALREVSLDTLLDQQMAFVREQAFCFISGIAYDDGVIGGMREERIHASLGFDDQCPRLIQGVETLTGPAERLRVHFIPTRIHYGNHRCSRFEGTVGHGTVGLNFQAVDGDEGNALGVANAFGS